MVKKLDEYTRSELVKVQAVAEDKIRVLYEYLTEKEQGRPSAISEALRNEADKLQGVVKHIENRLEALHARCIFCKEKQPVEVATITFICKPCDNKVFGRSGS
jgi:hypothetical protein